MTDLPRKALTLHRPWPYAILEHGKRTENRRWAPKSSPGLIALHAGKIISSQMVDLFTELAGGKLPGLALTEGIVGWARVHEAHPADRCPRSESCRIWGVDEEYHWMLSDVRRLDNPIPAKGMQGLWPLSAEQRSRLESARTMVGV